MAITEIVLDTTPNKKWSIVAVITERKNIRTDTALSFKITDGTMSDRIRIKRVSMNRRRGWEINCESFPSIPKYVRLFMVKYFGQWFSPIQLPT